MISIVICTRSNDISFELRKNINETIGVVFEIIVIDNTTNNYSIFSAYNRGVSLSKFDIICFMHDDIIFNSNNWGWVVVNQFQQKNLGAVGVAGTPYYAALPGGWWSGGLICQHINGQNDYAYQPIVNNALPVVAIDGLWFCIKKEIFNYISFDEDRFKGFHYYDIDISLQIKDLGFDILSLYNITITHTSGKLDKTWLQNAIILQQKWSKKLPFSVLDLNYAQEVKIEYGVLLEYMNAMKLNGSNTIKTIQFAANQILKFRLKRFSIIFPFVLIAIASKHLFKKMGLR